MPHPHTMVNEICRYVDFSMYVSLSMTTSATPLSANKVLHRNSYPHMDQDHSQKTTKEAFVSVPYIQGLSEEFRRIFQDTKIQIIFKGCNTLKTLLMHPKDEIPTQLYEDLVYQWTYPEDSCNFLILENQADAWKAGSKNKIPLLQVQYSNIAQPMNTLKLTSLNLKS